MLLMKKWQPQGCFRGPARVTIRFGIQVQANQDTPAGNHPIWSRMVPVLQQDSTWPLDQLSEELRLKDVHEASILAITNPEPY